MRARTRRATRVGSAPDDMSDVGQGPDHRQPRHVGHAEPVLPAYAVRVAN
jgi:hypothetical protein